METEIETLFNINDCAALIFDSSEQKCIYNFNLKGHIHHILLNKYSSHRIVTTIIISIMLVLLVALQVIFNGNKII